MSSLRLIGGGGFVSDRVGDNFFSYSLMFPLQMSCVQLRDRCLWGRAAGEDEVYSRTFEIWWSSSLGLGWYHLPEQSSPPLFPSIQQRHPLSGVSENPTSPRHDKH